MNMPRRTVLIAALLSVIMVSGCDFGGTSGSTAEGDMVRLYVQKNILNPASADDLLVGIIDCFTYDYTPSGSIVPTVSGTLGYQTGAVNYAIDFNNYINSYLQYSVGTGFDPDVYSISVWLKSLSALSGDCTLDSTDRGTVFRLTDSSGQPCFRLLAYCPGTGTGYKYALQIYGATGNDILYPPDAPQVANGQWVHVVFTVYKSLRVVRIWYNTVEYDSMSVGFAPRSSDTGSVLSVNLPPSGYSAFKGLVDDLRFYDRALEYRDVLGLYKMKTY